MGARPLAIDGEAPEQDAGSDDFRLAEAVGEKAGRNAGERENHEQDQLQGTELRVASRQNAGEAAEASGLRTWRSAKLTKLIKASTARSRACADVKGMFEMACREFGFLWRG